MKINGWKRLWVFFCVIGIIPFGIISFNDINKSYKRNHNISFSKFFEERIEKENAFSENKKHNDDITKEDILETLSEINKERSKHKLSKIYSNHFYKESLEIIFKSFLLWLIIMLVIYIFCWSLNSSFKWIYKGFKDS